MLFERQRPSVQTGTVIPSPHGVVWSYVPSGSRDSARPDVAPPSNYQGGVGWSGLAEPNSLVPISNGMYMAPLPGQLPNLADILRRVLLGS